MTFLSTPTTLSVGWWLSSTPKLAGFFPSSSSSENRLRRFTILSGDAKPETHENKKSCCCCCCCCWGCYCCSISQLNTGVAPYNMQLYAHKWSQRARAGTACVTSEYSLITLLYVIFYFVYLFPEPVWPSGKALGWKAEELRLESISALLSLQKLWSVDMWHCLVTLSLTINETLKWLSSLPILMQESFWWWQCSDRYIISLFPHLHNPFPSSLISLAVFVDVKHYVYCLFLSYFSFFLYSPCHMGPQWLGVKKPKLLI